jgi:hypothetical protein
VQRNEENIEHEHHVTDIEQQLEKSYRERERERESILTVRVQKHYKRSIHRRNYKARCVAISIKEKTRKLASNTYSQSSGGGRERDRETERESTTSYISPSPSTISTYLI